MLDLIYPFDGGVAHSYKVNLITDRDYKDAKHRLLFVMQTVLTDDLKAHQLISTKEAPKSPSTLWRALSTRRNA